MKNNERREEIKKIACVLPMSKSEYRHKNSQDFIHMSGLIITQEMLRNMGYIVKTFDYLRYEDSNHAALDIQIEEFCPDVICICGMFCIEDIVDFVKEHSKSFIHSIGIALGTGALGYEHCLKRIKGIDYVVPVNPEFVIRDIISVEERRLPKEELLGAAYLETDEVIFRKRKIDKLDDIFGNIDVRNYLSYTDTTMAYIWSSRGCWYRACTFCNVGTASSLCEGSAWQVRSIPLVIEDMRKLYDIGVRHFHFLDAEFIGPGQAGKDRAKEFANKVTESGMKISFYADIRVDCIDREVMELLYKSGLKSVFIGIESASNRVLDKIKKGYRLDSVKEAIDVIKGLGITYRIGTLLAIPESSLDDIEQSLEFFFENSLYSAMNIVGVGSVFHELHLHLGTPIYAAYQEYSGDKECWQGEIPCYYSDERVRVFIDCARRMHSRVLERYNLASKQDREEQFRKRYLFSLRIVALSGLRRIIQAIRNEADLDVVLNEIFQKHDEYWFVQGGDFLNGIVTTAVSI